MICPQANSASKISASDILCFCKCKRIATRMVQCFYFSCGGLVWALPCQVLKLCEFIKWDFRNSLPTMCVPKKMYCCPSSRANEYLWRYLKHYYMMKKKTQIYNKRNWYYFPLSFVQHNLEFGMKIQFYVFIFPVNFSNSKLPLLAWSQVSQFWSWERIQRELEL